MARFAGYSGTPLAQGLGSGEGRRFGSVDPPEGFEELGAPSPAGARFSPLPAKDALRVARYREVGAIDERWSGLRLVFCRELR